MRERRSTHLPGEGVGVEQVARKAREKADISDREGGLQVERSANVADKRDVRHSDLTENTSIPAHRQALREGDDGVEGTCVGDGTRQAGAERFELRFGDENRVDGQDGAIDNFLSERQLFALYESRRASAPGRWAGRERAGAD